ncbi:hypothetical protein [Phytoactinopolyspora limicola]|nr:hypothetical protein [Phytoactinopolyspora limicola]
MTDRDSEPVGEPDTPSMAGLVMMGEPGAGECVDGVCAVPTAGDQPRD